MPRTPFRYEIEEEGKEESIFQLIHVPFASFCVTFSSWSRSSYVITGIN